jgi:hypothetical protein
MMPSAQSPAKNDVSHEKNCSGTKRQRDQREGDAEIGWPMRTNAPDPPGRIRGAKLEWLIASA